MYNGRQQKLALRQQCCYTEDMAKRPVSKETRAEILRLRDRQCLGFREIATALDMDLCHTHKVYKKAKAEQRAMLEQLNNVPAPQPVRRHRPCQAPTPPLIETIEEPDTFVLPVRTEEEKAIILDPSTPTVPKGVLLEDDKLADKINHLVQRLLAITEGEAELLVHEMTGPQRIEAAAKMVDKMRTLRNQSTEAVNTNTFVELIGKITASMRKGLTAVEPHTLNGPSLSGSAAIDDLKPKKRGRPKTKEVPDCLKL